MIHGCSGQLRVAPRGGVFGLDFGAIFAVAAASGLAGSALLADALPDVERIAVRRFNETEGDQDGD